MEFELAAEWSGQRILLHFGAVSRECAVFLNGVEVCRHEQAYLPFSADISKAVHSGVNTLRVTAVNDLSPKYPWGKQRRKRGGTLLPSCIMAAATGVQLSPESWP